MEFFFNVYKPAGFIFSFLTDMEKFADVHPVISKIDNLGNNNYLVHETLKLGFIPWSFTYPVTVQGDEKNKTVRITATVMKLTRIEMVFTVKEVPGFALVSESISISTLLPIKTVIKRIFYKQHKQLFENISALS